VLQYHKIVGNVGTCKMQSVGKYQRVKCGEKCAIALIFSGVHFSKKIHFLLCLGVHLQLPYKLCQKFFFLTLGCTCTQWTLLVCLCTFRCWTPALACAGAGERRRGRTARHRFIVAADVANALPQLPRLHLECTA